MLVGRSNRLAAKVMHFREGAELSPDALELAVVVPTFNEVANIVALVDAIQAALHRHAFEIIIVDDDSPDGTADCVREIARRNIHVRCIQRIGRRGLSGAVVEGALATAAPIVAVIDGDMQHDEKVLPVMLETLRSQELDVVVGSRYLEGSEIADWSGGRLRLSKLATALACRVTGVVLSDPMSGFFMIRTDVLRRLVPNLSAIGFKIFLDILISAPAPLRCRELAYCFRPRSSGISKMDVRVVMEFLELLIDKVIGHVLPAKFVMFALVGSFGIFVHIAVLGILFKGLGADFQTGQIAAVLTAITSNFALNNVLTYYDRRLSGWAWIKGWCSFALACSIGAIANVGIATYLFNTHRASWLVSGLAGVLVGVAWNYATTSLFTWKVAGARQN